MPWQLFPPGESELSKSPIIRIFPRIEILTLNCSKRDTERHYPLCKIFYELINIISLLVNSWVRRMGKVRVFRCRICADPYIGEEPPSRCPFCGASSEYFVLAEDWNPREYDVDMSETSRSNLEAALKLELDNTAFYTCAMDAAKAAGDEYGLAKFKALKKVENEHASAICKFLKIDKPPLNSVHCSSDFKANTQEGWEREDRAIKSYAKFRDEATEERLKEFFGALVEIETDHLDLHAENL